MNKFDLIKDLEWRVDKGISHERYSTKKLLYIQYEFFRFLNPNTMVWSNWRLSNRTSFDRCSVNMMMGEYDSPGEAMGVAGNHWKSLIEPFLV